MGQERLRAGSRTGRRRIGPDRERHGRRGGAAARQAGQLQVDTDAGQAGRHVRLGASSAKQGLDGGFTQTLGPGEVGQGRHIGQGGVGGDDAELIAQRHHLQTGRRRGGAGKGLPLQLEHLAIENAGKFAALGAGIGPRAGAWQLASPRSGGRGGQKVHRRVHEVVFLMVATGMWQCHV